MLGFLTTDAAVPPALLQRALKESARDTFNAITVDGEGSTNDCAVAMASGASGVMIDESRIRRCSKACWPCLANSPSASCAAARVRPS